MGDSQSVSEEDLPPDTKEEEDEDDEKIVERDPTGRYGRYDIILGKGAFKTVYKAFDEVEGIEIAWNQVKVSDVLQSQEDLDRLYSEVHLLKTLKHKNIIKFYNSWVDARTKNVNFITEIFTSGTLRQYRKKHKHCDMKAVKNWSRQILRGLLYLHSHDPPIIHRDLKCDNIFVNGNQGEVKIGDLGLAAILHHKNAAHSVIGTPEFMAPELYEEEYNELVDIYAFGMCVLEMVTFEYPYSECSNAAQIYKRVVSGKKPAALDKVKDPQTRAFVEKCLAAADRRLPARELLADPFLMEGEREGAEAAQGLPRSESKAEDLNAMGEKTYASVVSRGAPVLRNENDPKDPSPAHDVKMSTRHGFDVSPGKNGAEGVISKPSEEEELHRSTSAEASQERPHSSRDFKVKGKKAEDDDDTIHLRLRIVDSQGHIRNIHFPFNIHNDGAFSVASEMVEELDLSDQDVSNIAEMIDAEILKLVPDWKPGLSLDETTSTGNMESEAGDYDNDLDLDELEQEVGPKPDSNQASARSRSESPSRSRSGSRSRQMRANSPSMSSVARFFLNSASPPNLGLDLTGTSHGRFWEGPLDISEGQSGFSSDDSDATANEGNFGDYHESLDAQEDSKGSFNKEGFVGLPRGTTSRDIMESLSLENLKDGSTVSSHGSPNSSYRHSGRKSMTDFSHVVASTDAPFSDIIHSQSDAQIGSSFVKHGTLKRENPMSIHGDSEEGGDVADDEDLRREEEELRLEREHEMLELEMRYRKKLLEVRNRHRKGRADPSLNPSLMAYFTASPNRTREGKISDREISAVDKGGTLARKNGYHESEEKSLSLRGWSGGRSGDEGSQHGGSKHGGNSSRPVEPWRDAGGDGRRDKGHHVQERNREAEREGARLRERREDAQLFSGRFPEKHVDAGARRSKMKYERDRGHTEHLPDESGGWPGHWGEHGGVDGGYGEYKEFGTDKPWAASSTRRHESWYQREQHAYGELPEGARAEGSRGGPGMRRRPEVEDFGRHREMGEESVRVRGVGGYSSRLAGQESRPRTDEQGTIRDERAARGEERDRGAREDWERRGEERLWRVEGRDDRVMRGEERNFRPDDGMRNPSRSISPNWDMAGTYDRSYWDYGYSSSVASTESKLYGVSSHRLDSSSRGPLRPPAAEHGLVRDPGAPAGHEGKTEREESFRGRDWRHDEQSHALRSSSSRREIKELDRPTLAYAQDWIGPHGHDDSNFKIRGSQRLEVRGYHDSSRDYPPPTVSYASRDLDSLNREKGMAREVLETDSGRLESKDEGKPTSVIKSLHGDLKKSVSEGEALTTQSKEDRGEVAGNNGRKTTDSGNTQLEDGRVVGLSASAAETASSLRDVSPRDANEVRKSGLSSVASESLVVKPMATQVTVTAGESLKGSLPPRLGGSGELFHSSREAVGQKSAASCDDLMILEQMKRDLLQRSIAELEAKTLQGLSNPKPTKNGYVPSGTSSVGVAMKKPSSLPQRAPP